MKRVYKNVVLIGMPGSGKTTLGKILAGELDKSFIDIDEYIEKQQECTISEIFKSGEEFFRDLESRAVAQVSKREDIVISTGGGVIKNKKNILNLSKKGLIIFIDRPLENIIGDLDINCRPLLKNNAGEIEKIFEYRYPVYRDCCDFSVKNVDTIENVVGNIIELITSIYGFI